MASFKLSGSVFFVATILATATGSVQALAASAAPVEAKQKVVDVQAAPLNPKSGAVRMPSELGPARVRIQLKLTPFETVNVRAPGGETVAKQVPLQPTEHILRARLEQTNHFYFQNWHVESVPLRWQKATGQYAVQLNVFKRFGPGNEVEEKLGSIRIDGRLEEAGPMLYSLIGTSSKDVENAVGQKTLSMLAGIGETTPSPVSTKPLVSKSGQLSEY